MGDSGCRIFSGNLQTGN